METIDDIIGMPYSRINCWGAVREYHYRINSVDVGDRPDPRQWQVANHAPTAGDVYAFSQNGKDVTGAGVVLPDGKILTSLPSVGVCVVPIRAVESQIAGRYTLAK